MMAAAAAAAAAAADLKCGSGRSRPTNNQLLYKAYFRWAHYGHKLRNGVGHLPTETDACASVTSAFLQVLHTLHVAEASRVAGGGPGGERRNILAILSNNTRRTKVVELSTGTHRVPDELRKHYLSDGERGQYSTNLDRNRYGNDDQYLFTVVRYDLEYLGLCPCAVDVEIIDAKNDHQSIFVSAGPEACTCHGGGNAGGAAHSAAAQAAAAAAAAAAHAASSMPPRPEGAEFSQEDDSDPVKAEGGAAGAGAGAGADDAAGLAADADADADADAGGPDRRARHVPRQSSAANLSARLSGAAAAAAPPAEVDRLAAEVMEEGGEAAAAAKRERPSGDDEEGGGGEDGGAARKRAAVGGGDGACPTAAARLDAEAPTAAA